MSKVGNKKGLRVVILGVVSLGLLLFHHKVSDLSDRSDHEGEIGRSARKIAQSSEKTISHEKKGTNEKSNSKESQRIPQSIDASQSSQAKIKVDARKEDQISRQVSEQVKHQPEVHSSQERSKTQSKEHEQKVSHQSHSSSKSLGTKNQKIWSQKESHNLQNSYSYFVVNDSGLSLSVISTMIYGTCKKWKKIAEWNHLKAPYRIYLGQKLRIKGEISVTQKEMAERLLNLWRSQMKREVRVYRTHSTEKEVAAKWVPPTPKFPSKVKHSKFVPGVNLKKAPALKSKLNSKGGEQTSLRSKRKISQPQLLSKKGPSYLFFSKVSPHSGGQRNQTLLPRQPSSAVLGNDHGPTTN